MQKKLLIGFSLLCALYLVYLLGTVSFIYFIFKKHAQEITILRLAEYDKDLGYHLKPNSHAVFTYPDCKPKCDVFIGPDSFRTDTANNATCLKEAQLVFLGCSFTFGDLCAYENTWPHIVADSLKATAINAGVGGYGFAQMLLSSQTVIPKYHPDLVVFENTDWLIERSQTPFMSFYPFTLAVPYFSSVGDSLFIVQPLVKSPILRLLNSNNFYATQASISDYFRFLKMFLPVLAEDDFLKLKYLALRLIGLVPVPEKSSAKIASYVFRQIEATCKQNNAQLVIMGVVNQSYHPSNSFKYVDAEKYLNGKLDSMEQYAQTYGQWYGNPPQCFDMHPNEMAHKRMAEAILKVLQ
jgi:hypothetical protein